MLGLAGVAAAAPGPGRVAWRSTVWTHPASDPYDLSNRYGFNHAPSVVALPDGKLLAAWFSGPFEASVHQVILSAVSTDGGRSWQVIGRLSTPAGADEPTVAEIGGGHLLMLLRTRDGFLWRSRSRDRGQTWSAPEKTSMVAAAASRRLFRTRAGRLVLTHDACPPPLRTPLTLRVSRDGGESWGEPAILDEVPVPRAGDDVWGRQAAYPSVAELPDGALVVVWADIVLSDAAQYGDIRAARVEL